MLKISFEHTGLGNCRFTILEEIFHNVFSPSLYCMTHGCHLVFIAFVNYCSILNLANNKKGDVYQPMAIPYY